MGNPAYLLIAHLILELPACLHRLAAFATRSKGEIHEIVFAHARTACLDRNGRGAAGLAKRAALARLDVIWCDGCGEAAPGRCPGVGRLQGADRRPAAGRLRHLSAPCHDGHDVGAGGRRLRRLFMAAQPQRRRTAPGRGGRQPAERAEDSRGGHRSEPVLPRTPDGRAPPSAAPPRSMPTCSITRRRRPSSSPRPAPGSRLAWANGRRRAATSC